MSWTFQTAHIRMEIEAGPHCPVITSLKGNAGFDWVGKPTELPLPTKLAVGPKKIDPVWNLINTQLENTQDGQELTLSYRTTGYNIILHSTWTSRVHAGVVEHKIDIVNESGEDITVYNIQTFDAELDTANQPTEVFYVCKDRLAPRIISFQTHTGVYLEELHDQYHADIWTGVDLDDSGFTPMVMLHMDQAHGLYVGWAWNEGRIHVTGRAKGGTLYAGIEAGLYNDFCTEVKKGETFNAPTAFIGAFEGLIDDGSNRLRRYLFDYYMPEENRMNEELPRVNWNAFWSTAIAPNSWSSEEKNYYSMIDALATVGMEEVTLDVGWWEEFGDFRGHHERWSKSIAAASQYAHDHGMQFSLYFAFLDGDSEDPMAFTSKGPNAHPEWMAQRWTADWGIKECRDFMKDMILMRLNEHGADNLRSDLSPIVRPKAPGNPHQGCHDGPYWGEKGYVEFMDHLIANKPHFRYQNCNCGCTLKGFNIMKRTSCIQITDVYDALSIRRALWSSTYCYPLMQLMTQFGDVLNNGVRIGDASYRFHSYLMGAPCAHMETPAEMSPEDAAYLAKLIDLFKKRVRPLVRKADVYHILHYPDGVHWDGMYLYDPAAGKGLVSVFRTDNEEDTQYIPLRGLDESHDYLVEYADGTLDNCVLSGAELAQTGVKATLANKFTAEWIFIQKISK